MSFSLSDTALHMWVKHPWLESLIHRGYAKKGLKRLHQILRQEKREMTFDMPSLKNMANSTLLFQL
jgi:hypothetical protein